MRNRRITGFVAGSATAILEVVASGGHLSTGTGAGLCGSCAYAKRIESDRGSVFLLCQRALTDKSFAKYPRLPVVTCKGFVRGMANNAPALEAERE